MSAQFDIYAAAMTRRPLGNRGDILGDQYGNMLVAQGLPSMANMALNGKIYSADISGGTALAPVTAMPTTAAQVALYNGGSGNTKLVILGAWATMVSGTTGLGGALIGCIPNAAHGSVLADYSGVVKGGINPGQGTTQATLKDAVTLAAAPNWVPLATDNTAAAVTVGGGFANLDLAGMFIVPPGYTFGLHVISPAGTTPLYDFGVMWAELSLETP